jgi:hypothetical protein
MLRAAPVFFSAILSVLLVGCVDNGDGYDQTLLLATPKGYAPAVAIAARTWEEKASAADALGVTTEEPAAAKAIVVPAPAVAAVSASAKRKSASFKPHHRARQHHRRGSH